MPTKAICILCNIKYSRSHVIVFGLSMDAIADLPTHPQYNIKYLPQQHGRTPIAICLIDLGCSMASDAERYERTSITLPGNAIFEKMVRILLLVRRPSYIDLMDFGSHTDIRIGLETTSQYRSKNASRYRHRAIIKLANAILAPLCSDSISASNLGRMPFH